MINTILRVANLTVLLPSMMLYCVFYTIYPILGYTIGRGFVRSIGVVANLIHVVLGDPFGALKMPLHVYRVAIYGEVSCEKVHKIIIHN